MTPRTILRSLAACLWLVAVVSCGTSQEEPSSIAVDQSAKFAAGTTMDKLHSKGSVRIGVKFDQPGLGFRKPGKSRPEGSGVQVGMLVAAKLGIEPKRIEWVEAVTKNREAFLQTGTVDLVVATYSITDKRRSVVSQAGPYYETGQRLLVRKGDANIDGPATWSASRNSWIAASMPSLPTARSCWATPLTILTS